jgi:uncharacterized membrane protein YdfJ with MMPL/SSD domain
VPHSDTQRTHPHRRPNPLPYPAASVGVPSIQHIGLGCSVAIALDATIVRLVLVPAAMKLLGRWHWYLPRPLERVLPQADFEVAHAGA